MDKGRDHISAKGREGGVWKTPYKIDMKPLLKLLKSVDYYFGLFWHIFLKVY